MRTILASLVFGLLTVFSSDPLGALDLAWGAGLGTHAVFGARWESWVSGRSTGPVPWAVADHGQAWRSETLLVFGGQSDAAALKVIRLRGEYLWGYFSTSLSGAYHGFPGTALGVWNLQFGNALDIGWAFLHLELGQRWLPDAPAQNTLLELQTLARLGLRFPLVENALSLELEANSGSGFDLPNLQALGYEARLLWSLTPEWQARIEGEFRQAGSVTLAATPLFAALRLEIRRRFS